MPELIRSVVSRARNYLKDRRQSPRLRVRLMFTVSLPRPQNGNGLSRPQNGNGLSKPTHFLTGHTRDVSVHGMALLVSSIHMNGRHLAADGLALDVRLNLGDGHIIRMQVTPERYERLDEREMGCAYLIGVRIVKVDEDDRQLYENFISNALARKRG